MTAEAMSASGGDAAALNRTYVKIMWRIMPMVLILWLTAFIDRTNIGFAMSNTMPADLGLSRFTTGLASSMFFLGYIIWEIPSNLALTKWGAKRTLTRIAVLWGIANSLMMFAGNGYWLGFFRFLLGSFEAGLFPGVLLYMTFWLPSERRAKMVGWFASMGGLAGFVGAFLYPIIVNNLTGVGGFAGWRWLFMIEGLITIVCGIVAWFVIVDGPDEARWLSDSEKAALKADLAREAEVMSHRKEKFMPQLATIVLWVLVLGQLTNNYCFTAVSTWGPLMVKEAGIGDPSSIGSIFKIISLLTFVVMVVIGYSSDFFNDTKRHYAAVAFLSAVGMVVVALAPSTPGVVIPGLAVATAFSGAAVAAFWAIPSRVYARMAIVVGFAFVSSAGNVGGFFSSSVLGFIRDEAGSYAGAFYFMAALYVFAGVMVLIFISDRASAKRVSAAAAE